MMLLCVLTASYYISTGPHAANPPNMCRVSRAAVTAMSADGEEENTELVLAAADLKSAISRAKDFGLPPLARGRLDEALEAAERAKESGGASRAALREAQAAAHRAQREGKRAD